MVVTEDKHSRILQQLMDSGEATPPVEHRTPDPVSDLAPTVDSLSDLLIEDRDNERSS
jgi:hypothetical protein